MDRMVFNNGTVEDYTIVLCTKAKKKLGQLTGLQNVQFKNSLNQPAEISFSIAKHDLLRFNGDIDFNIARYKKIKNELWKRIVDLKLIWIKELDKYFEINVQVSDSNKSLVKTITATHLCEAELSQLLLENIEINSESDILRDDYVPTVFYNPENPEASLLNRILIDKAPHYYIKYVDESLKNIQRTFSISGTTIYDFLVGECATQFNCLFVFDSTDRSISAYDLYAVCEDCGHRHEDYNVCPKCGSINNTYFGTDTAVLIDKDNLTENIQLEVDAGSIKNCFKLVAGDDLMTNTVRLLNRNGSDYLYYFSELQREDMPEELTQKIDEYNDLYDSYDKQYHELVNQFYELTDHKYYLESGMMPTPELGGITAQGEADKLTFEVLSPIGMNDILPPSTETNETATHLLTVNSAIKNYAKVIVKSGYVKVDIPEEGSSFTYGGVDADGYDYGYWSGKIIITNYADEEDIATVTLENILVHDNYIDYMNQKLLKQMNQDDSEGSVYDVLGISYPDDREREYTEFAEALKYYCKNRLISFYDAIKASVETLGELGHNTESGFLYEALYVPYNTKLTLCNEALTNLQSGENYTYEKDGESFTQNLNSILTDLEIIEQEMMRIQGELDFKKYLGDLYSVFCSYRREDIYSNDNFISDGLNNKELIDRALEFIDVAEKELYRSGERQINISSTLYNLLTIKEFQPIVNHFEIGNWIRVKVDGQVYRLRLLSYSINFNSLQTINVEFATVSKIKDLVHEAQQIHKSISSISSSYSYVSKQATQGEQAQNNIQDWIQNGLSSALVHIKNNENEEIIYDKRGILGRSWDDITETYDPKQVRIAHNAILFTKDNWDTVDQAIGEHSYDYYDADSNEWTTTTDYGLTAKHVSAGIVYGSDIIGGKIFSKQYSDGTHDREATGTLIDLVEGTFSFAGGKLRYDGEDLFIDSISIDDALKEIKSDQIVKDLGNKTIMDSRFYGDFYASSITATTENSSHKGITGNYTVGNATLQIVNGIIVGIT